MANRLTEDMYNEVLLRLPIKSCLRCKAVSKSWRSLISSHRFAKSHLQRALTTAPGVDQTLIIHTDEYDDVPNGDGPFLLFHLDSLQFGADLNFPYSSSSRLVGSDCGILCVSVFNSCRRKTKTDIHLWNPATKQSKRIPSQTIQDCETSVSIGFGFDHIDFDCKVVRVARCGTVSRRTIFAEVYSSNRNVWREIETELTDFPSWNDFHTCLHGFLFTSGYNSVMAFDLGKEMFICDIDVPASSFNDDGRRFEGQLSVFNDSIAVFKPIETDSKIKLWTLDDEACLRGARVKASWTLMLSIDVSIPFLFVDGFFNNAEFLGFNGDARSLYNPNTKVFRDVPQIPSFLEVFKYTASLFSVAGSKPVNWTASSSRLQDDSDSYYSDLDEESSESDLNEAVYDD